RCEIAQRMCKSEHADRREQEGAGQPATEELHARVATRDVVEDAWNDAPALEPFTVRGDRAFESRAARDVRECLARHPLACTGLELREVDRHRRLLSAGTAEVDLLLASRAAALRAAE